MDNRPVGIFDSGLGGLSCVKEFMQIMPGEDMVFFGDTARVPYGNRSPETLRRYAAQDAAFLLSRSVKAVVIACGTVSSVVDESFLSSLGCPCIEVVSPAAAAAAQATRSGRIGIIGTAATIRSGRMAAAVQKAATGSQVFAKACPLFVPAVENGHIADDDPLVALLAEEYLSGLKAAGIDTLVLGCTHYPLIAGAIDRFFGGSVTLVNSGREAARETQRVLSAQGMLSGGDTGSRSFFVTDSPEGFSSTAELFLGGRMPGSVELVSLADIERSQN